MSRRPSIRDLELKLKAALLELKASKEMCDCLISERDDHETEIRSVIFMNTKLKGELAEMDVKCNDLTDQRDRLQAGERNGRLSESLRAVPAADLCFKRSIHVI
ncbi:hypothetical protein EVAR_90161_1 [Eumeta japonica]|uniref:Uncharacterized protein n=1 Tax=Eumeta variegata TaxID=151549 RepID=A0A4C1S9Q2_EUMVA|nr:hypothetical protein EVAR_90161_1 [Eumeta japonica]